jgi:spore coat polysaccharide biosynthesis predicted glycosyltransferase SpsG
MRYIIHADASQSIGSGHVMRCSAIAEELIARGEDVIFVGQISELPWVEKRIAILGFSQIYTDSREFISNPVTDVLLLDSYHIEVDNPFIDSKKWLHIVVIVDELTPAFACDLKIHPGLDPSWFKDSSIPILAGPKFIPLRASLSENTSVTDKKSGILKIVVVAGGSDPYNVVLEISKILAGFSETFEAYLFTNSAVNFNLDGRFRFCKIGLSLEEVSRDADFILTTSSTSSLEFIAQGHCVGIICAVENQKQYYVQLGHLGVAAQIGERNKSTGWSFKTETIHMLLTDSKFRAKIKNDAYGLIDFMGAKRIVDALMSLPKGMPNDSGEFVRGNFN